VAGDKGPKDELEYSRRLVCPSQAAYISLPLSLLLPKFWMFEGEKYADIYTSRVLGTKWF
jgi:hypothetical protein